MEYTIINNFDNYYFYYYFITLIIKLELGILIHFIASYLNFLFLLYS